MMDVTETCTDVLQNIEFTINQVYERHRGLQDWDVILALKPLVAQYRDELRHYQAKPAGLTGFSEVVYQSARAVCEWRLGRGESPFPVNKKDSKGLSENTLDEIYYCVRKIKRSAEKWNGENGQRGYLDFISRFV